MSFAVPFQDMVNRLSLLGISNVDQDTPFRYVLGTSKATTTLAHDLAGPFDGISSSSTWDVLNAMSLAYSAGAGAPVPEPGTDFLVGLGLVRRQS